MACDRVTSLEVRITGLEAAPQRDPDLGPASLIKRPEYKKMKSLILAAASAATLIAPPLAASAADSGSWYVRGDAGATDSGKIDGTNGPRSDNGWTLDAGVGKSFGNGWRAEGQILYLDKSGKSGYVDQKVVGGF